MHILCYPTDEGFPQACCEEELTCLMQETAKGIAMRYVPANTEGRIIIQPVVIAIHEDRLSFIYIGDRHDNDDGRSWVLGWTYFVTADRGTKQVTNIVRSHNLSIRCLINDFYGEFVIFEKDIENIRQAMIRSWRNMIRSDPVMNDKPASVYRTVDLEKMNASPLLQDVLIKGVDYLLRDTSCKAIKEHLSYNKPRFIGYQIDQATSHGYLILILPPESKYRLAIIRYLGDSIIGATFCEHPTMASLRDVIYWITSVDDDYEELDSCLDRELKRQDNIAEVH